MAAADTTLPASVSTTPLDDSLNKLLGTKKKAASPIGYDPNATFRPGEDTITVAGTPATGATTAESWSHDIALENLKQQELQQEFQQRQTLADAAFKQQQADIANQLSQSQFGLSKAADTRAASQAALTAQETQQAMALKAAAEGRAKADALVKYGGYTEAQIPQLYAMNQDYSNFRGGTAVVPGSDTAYAAYVAAKNKYPVTNTGGLDVQRYKAPVKDPNDVGFHYLGIPAGDIASQRYGY